MKVLVLGGCGFLGSHVVDLLVERGHAPLVHDDLSTAELEDDGVTPRYRNVGAVYLRGPCPEGNLREVEAIVHLALRHPLERERALYAAAWNGFVRQGVETVLAALDLRAPLKRVVIGATAVAAYYDRFKNSPVLNLQNSLFSALEYWHRPGSLSIHPLYLPELRGERRSPSAPFLPTALQTARVEVAAARVVELLEEKPSPRFEQYLRSEDIEEVE